MDHAFTGKRQGNLHNGKRGRGRPRKPDAISNAERQAPWRTLRGARTKSVAVTENIPLSAEAHDALVRECEQLRGELVRAQRKLEAVSQTTPPTQAPSDVAVALGRLPRPEDAGSGERRRHLTMNSARFFALERLAARFGLSRG